MRRRTLLVALLALAPTTSAPTHDLISSLGFGSICSIAAAQEQATLSADGKRYTQTPAPAEVEGGEVAAGNKRRMSEAFLKEGTNPKWIWGTSDNRNYVLRKKFTLPKVSAAWIVASCDNQMTISLNGKKIGSSSEWETASEIDVVGNVKAGENAIEVEASNAGGIAAFVLKMIAIDEAGKIITLESDDSWEAQDTRAKIAPLPARIVANYGDGPWGAVFSSRGEATKGKFNLPAGFAIDRLFTLPKEELGSWVCITTDNKGRLIASDQGDRGLCRITPPAPGSDQPTIVERIDVPISAAQGLLYAFDSLYVSVNGGNGSGLYRVRDTNGDDQFDNVEKLKEFRGGGEHGPHALRLSPDGKSIYVCCGNHTLPPFERKLSAPVQTMGGPRSEVLTATLPEGVTSRIEPNWDEDLLLPRQWDANGHAAGIVAPGGWIASTDPEGKTWEVFTVGYRNQYDFDFNADGEMFVYDADMEWDMGAPWYRPTRVVHATSGSEFGWRSGTGKWPTNYLDSLPQLVDIGPGSPVGVEFGEGAKFPAKYQKALFICDWTFGTMYAIHMEPDGASYKGVKEEFVSRTPLPLTDVTIGSDGFLYFTIGGRGTQSELYRVRYVGTESTDPVNLKDARLTEMRQLRSKIETYHKESIENPERAVDFLLPYLDHSDRHIRYAARVALERIPAKLWGDAIVSSRKPSQLLTGAAGLARSGAVEYRDALLGSLLKLDPKSLSETQLLELARTYQLILIRLGALSPEARAALTQQLDPLFPSQSDALNRELANLLVFLESPSAPAKIVPLLAKEHTMSQEDLSQVLARNRGYGASIAAMLANQPDLQQIHYAFALRNQKTGWTIEQRKAYFEWYNKASKWTGGNSYQKFLSNMSDDAYVNCTDQERFVLEAVGARKRADVPAELPKAAGPGKNYTMDEIMNRIGGGLKGRNFENGKKMYAAARCVLCHRFGGEGGSTGPDLTQLAGRFNPKDLTEAIVDPSKVISDQYKTTIIETNDGEVYTGRIVTDYDGKITMVIDPENSTKTVTIERSEIAQEKNSPVSLMPKELLKELNEEEMLDLFAYLLSRGNEGDPAFRK